MTPAVIPTDLPSARRFLCASGLSGSEVIRVWVPAVARSACLIETESGEGWFVKQLDEALELEDRVYEYRQRGLLPHGIETRLTPRLLANADVRVYHGFRECRTWHELLSRPQGYRAVLAERIGRWVGEMHRDARPSQALLDAALPNRVPLVRSPDGIDVDTFASAPGFQIEEFLVAAQRVGPELAELAKRPRPCDDRVVVHGDLKADNVLVGDELYLVDWELLRIGDPMFDLGTLLGSMLSAWLETVSARPGEGLAQWFAAAPVPSAQLVNSITCLIRSYEDAFRPPDGLDLDALWRYTGVFLLERGYVTNSVYGRFLLSTRVAMELGVRLLAQPSLGPALFHADAT